jgi:hypothetical protein
MKVVALEANQLGTSYDVIESQLTALLALLVIMVRLRRMSSKPVMMLPMLNTKDMELVIWAGEGLIHVPAVTGY